MARKIWTAEQPLPSPEVKGAVLQSTQVPAK